jgi:ankyrin repeat protein
MTASVGSALTFDRQERLCLAARNGPVENICALVKEGADVLKYDAMGLTTLHCAAYYGNVETVRVILVLGGLRCACTGSYTVTCKCWNQRAHETSKGTG